MTKLEQIIYDAIVSETEGSNIDRRLAEVSASAVLTLIEEAWDEAGEAATAYEHGHGGYLSKRAKWLSENITGEVKQEEV